MLDTASVIGKGFDLDFGVIVGVCVALFAIIIGLMLYFLLRYHKTKNPIGSDIKGDPVLESTLLVSSVVLVMFLFYWGWGGYKNLKVDIPKDAMAVRATGQMWQWSFQYPNGVESNTLNLPLNKPIKMIISSRDVIHGFFVPAFRVKQDALPGSLRAIWFTPDKEGTYDLFCTQYCGTGHSGMLTKVNVMPEDKYAEWFNSALAQAAEAKKPAAPLSGAALVNRGKELYTQKGCAPCHSIDGSKLVGPTWKDMYGSKVKVTTNGKEREVVVDDAYIIKSEYEPQADVVVGYQPVMPPQKGILSEQDVKALIAFMKTLSSKGGGAVPSAAPAAKAPAKATQTAPQAQVKQAVPQTQATQKAQPQAGKKPNAQAGQQLFTSKGCISCHSIDGSKRVGPIMKGLYGSKIKVTTGGKQREVTADDAYLKKSMLEPNADVVVGYQPIMPPQKGVLNDNEIASIVEYVKTLK